MRSKHEGCGADIVSPAASRAFMQTEQLGFAATGNVRVLRGSGERSHM